MDYKFDERVNVRELDAQFPDDELGQRRLQLVSDSQDLEHYYNWIGLCKEERVFGCLFLAYHAGSILDLDGGGRELIGVFGCDRFVPQVDVTLTTLWVDGELAPTFQEAGEYWALSEEAREAFVFSQ
jgi:hypothetical protein